MRSDRDEYNEEPEAGEEQADAMDDRDMPDESDMDEHDEPDLIPCPHCRKMITEDAEKCHHCGEWVDDAGTGRLSVIVIVVIVLLLVTAVLGWLFGR